MRLVDNGLQLSATIPVKVQPDAFVTIAQETDLTVDAVIVQVCTAPAAGKSRLVEVTNISTGGQRIRIGAAPAFGAPSVGELLNPGESLTWVIGNMTGGVNAIADAAGGLLNRSIQDT